MAERYKLPEHGRTTNFYAEFTLVEEDGTLVATEGWINAPHRGNEIFEIIQNKLQEIATGKGVVVVHRFEAATIKGKNLIQRQNGYEWKKRSTEGYSIYERKFLP